MRSKIIGIIGGIVTLIGVASPWLVIRGTETLYGFNKVFGLLFIITLLLGLVGIGISLIRKRMAGLLSLIVGLILIGWGIYLKSEVKSFGIKYAGAQYGAEWLGETVASFLNIGYGIYLVIFGGILILLAGVLKLREK